MQDAFTGTNGTGITAYSANWAYNVGSGVNLQIQSNGVQCAAANLENGVRRTEAGFPADQFAEITFAATTANNEPHMGVSVRGATNQYYGWYGSQASTQLFKYDGTTWTQLGADGAAVAATNTFRLTVAGTTLTPSKNGSTVNPPGAQTDATYGSGAPGLSAFNNSSASANIRIDNFLSTDPAAGIPLAKPRLARFDRATGLRTVRARPPAEAFLPIDNTPQPSGATNIPPLGQATPKVIRLNLFKGAPFLARVRPATAAVVSAFTLDAQPGSFTLTGIAAGAEAQRIIDAQPGSFTLTGFLATLAKGFFLDAQPGTFTLTGFAAALAAGRVIDAQPGSFTITGFQAALHAGRIVDAQPGSFVLTGFQAALHAGRILDAQPGAFALTGFVTDLLYTPVSGAFVLSADPGSFTITGFDTSAVADRFINADPGSFTLTGVAATFAVERSISADPASFIVTGFDATFDAPIPTPLQRVTGGFYELMYHRRREYEERHVESTTAVREAVVAALEKSGVPVLPEKISVSAIAISPTRVEVKVTLPQVTKSQLDAIIAAILVAELL
jgi:hypothetical protein